MSRIVALLLLTVLPLLCSGCMGSRDLSGPEITALLKNARVEGEHVTRGYRFVREYDDKTFTQIQPDERKATWHVSGNKLVIKWSNGQQFTRIVRTNDRGDYWKVLRKRSGGYKTVVEYHGIIDRDSGRSRAKMGNPVTVALRLLFSPCGWGVMIAGFIGFLVWKGTRPTPLTAGGQTYLPNQLLLMSRDEVDAFLGAALQERNWSTASGIFAVILRQPPRPAEGCQRMWKVVRDLDDAEALAALTEIVQTSGTQARDLLKMAHEQKDPTRAIYLLGKGYCLWAEAVRRSYDGTPFKTAREGAMLLLDELRSAEDRATSEAAAKVKEAATDEPETKLEDIVVDATKATEAAKAEAAKAEAAKAEAEAAQAAIHPSDYPRLAVAAYETVLYLEHDPPRSSGGGGGGGG